MAFFFDRRGVLRVREFGRWPWLVHGFSTRSNGDLSRREDQESFARLLAGRDMELVTLRQIHSAIARLADGTPVCGLPGDSLLTRHAGMMVGVKTADCLPVLVVDPRRRAVAAIHAGWRGAVKRVVERAVGEMRLQLGSEPSDLHAAVGPGIQACCFEVGPEVLEEFAGQFADAAEFCRADPPNPALIMLPKQILTGGHALMRRLDSDRGRVDLTEAVRRQLISAGVPREQIYASGLCTACDSQRFYSFRREKEAAGRMLSVAGISAH